MMSQSQHEITDQTASHLTHTAPHTPIQLRTSIVLVNLGTPSHPTYFATMRFLRSFLSDPRVVNISKWLWYPILYGFILPFRSYSSKCKYQKIHDEHGMPLMYFSERLLNKVKQSVESSNPNTKVYLAMRYGDRSIEETLKQIKHLAHQQLIILPLFPQYSATTTASIFDEVAKQLRAWNFLPHYTFIRDYCNRDDYIGALAHSIQRHWDQYGRGEKLLLTYHGLPEANHADGDPYACYCRKTTRLIVERLGLSNEAYMTVFQSRFGPSQWLKPYTEDRIIELAKNGVKTLDVIAPSFSVDCLETIDEITREYQEIFVAHGGKKLSYIPALNDNPDAVQLMCRIIQSHLINVRR